MICNNNEKAKRKIEQDSKKRMSMGCCCPIAITGPTGPQGENGLNGISDTIKIRNTITSEAGNMAQVIDTTGNPNHILDFIIPRGYNGEIGPTGPQGIQGITGPTGPTGSISFNCYGMAHSTIDQSLNDNDYVPFNESDKVSNMMIAQSGIITLAIAGTYLINWSIVVNPIDATEGIVNFELQEISPDNRTLGWSTSGAAITNTDIVVLHGTALVDAGYDSITRNFALVNTSNAEIYLNPNNEVGAVITVTKIN